MRLNVYSSDNWMNAHVCVANLKTSEIKRNLVRLQGDCICQQSDPPSRNVHVLSTERDIPTARVGELEHQPLPGSVPRFPVCIAGLLIQTPAQHGQGLGGYRILAGLVRVEHSVLEDEPGSLPTLTTTSPAKISGHLASFAVSTQL